MTVNNELKKTRLTVVVAHSKVLPQHLPGETKENHENISLRQKHFGLVFEKCLVQPQAGH
jgi:hypothetical protein